MKEIVDDSRECKLHGKHGSLYICPYYSESLKDEIRENIKKFKEQFESGELELTIIEDQTKITKVKIKDFKDMKDDNLLAAVECIGIFIPKD